MGGLIARLTCPNLNSVKKKCFTVSFMLRLCMFFSVPCMSTLHAGSLPDVSRSGYQFSGKQFESPNPQPGAHLLLPWTARFLCAWWFVLSAQNLQLHNSGVTVSDMGQVQSSAARCNELRPLFLEVTRRCL